MEMVETRSQHMTVSSTKPFTLSHENGLRFVKIWYSTKEAIRVCVPQRIPITEVCWRVPPTLAACVHCTIRSSHSKISKEHNVWSVKNQGKYPHARSSFYCQNLFIRMLLLKFCVRLLIKGPHVHGSAMRMYTHV